MATNYRIVHHTIIVKQLTLLTISNYFIYDLTNDCRWI